MPSLKTRIKNLLIATTWLLITAVWIPTFWTLAELPGTLDNKKASALLEYAEYDIGTIHYSWSQTYYAKPCGDAKNWLTCELAEEKAELDSLKYTISTGGSFVPLTVFTLLVLGTQYLLTGKVTLRFTKATKEEDS